jgi:hypothetical protein
MVIVILPRVKAGLVVTPDKLPGFPLTVTVPSTVSPAVIFFLNNKKKNPENYQIGLYITMYIYIFKMTSVILPLVSAGFVVFTNSFGSEVVDLAVATA